MTMPKDEHHSDKATVIAVLSPSAAFGTETASRAWDLSARFRG